MFIMVSSLSLLFIFISDTAWYIQIMFDYFVNPSLKFINLCILLYLGNKLKFAITSDEYLIH